MLVISEVTRILYTARFIVVQVQEVKQVSHIPYILNQFDSINLTGISLLTCAGSE